MRWRVAFVLILVLGVFASRDAYAQKRVALVIGNSAYMNAPVLPHPAKDAESISDMLRRSGFDVVETRRDANNLETRRALRSFSDIARNADMAVVYFSGHGMEVDGQNYLLPTDARLQREYDAYDEAISLDRVLQSVEGAKVLRLVILDACRENPFAQSMVRTSALRSVTRGLITVEPNKPDTLIAYAAKSGTVAETADGANSPYAAALIKHLPTPGLDLRQAFGRVRDDVMKETKSKQEPFVYGSLGGSTVSLVQTAALSNTTEGTAASTTADNPRADIRKDYEYAERVKTKAAWDSFLNAYPNGFYSDLARAQLSKLSAEQAGVEATEKAKAAAAEKARLDTEGAKQSERAEAARKAKAAEAARVAAEKNKRREQDRLAAAERRKQRGEARAAEQAKAVALPPARAETETPRANSPGPKRAAGETPATDQRSLYARCDAIVPKGANDDYRERPARVDYCVSNGGRP
jgi:uncharacterized caspase-like protein